MMFDDLVDAYALTSIPKRGSSFYLVVYDGDDLAADDFAGDAIAFRSRARAVECAKLLSNGNMARKIIKCAVVQRIPSTDEQALGRRKS